MIKRRGVFDNSSEIRIIIEKKQFYEKSICSLLLSKSKANSSI